ncbi:hypothetical protein [Palpita vitrealis nucleopolyhedrovirus]|uniref:Uncharacterized protein n=1 Tax=Palpita vitrealis nucleopolyhedrovirus TaxID=2951960 RepID=A0AAE9LNH8_9ABAC|nr:hypothetical protein [Palpita vitrealis nucleopolyhedrovirus]
MYDKFLIYLHLNGLHGEAKYYEYLMSQMDFENQMADEIKRFCTTRLKPAITCINLATETIDALVNSVVCKNKLLNPYAKEVQFALQYMFDDDEITNEDQERFKILLFQNYKNYDFMNQYLCLNNLFVPKYEFKDMFDIVKIDYKNLLSLVNKYI